MVVAPAATPLDDKRVPSRRVEVEVPPAVDGAGDVALPDVLPVAVPPDEITVVAPVVVGRPLDAEMGLVPNRPDGHARALIGGPGDLAILERLQPPIEARNTVLRLNRAADAILDNAADCGLVAIDRAPSVANQPERNGGARRALGSASGAGETCS